MNQQATKSGERSSSLFRPTQVQQHLLLLIAPLSTILSGLWLRKVAGPFWLGGTHDPDYAYLFNSLKIARLEVAPHSDHPGTTLQLFGGLLLRLLQAFEGTAEITEAVLRSPERYLLLLHFGLLLLCAACSFLAGQIAFRAQRSLAPALAIQLIPLSSATFLFSLRRFDPEPMVETMALLAAALAFHLAVRGESSPRRPRLVVALGAVSGLGIATKLTFFPVVLLPLAVLISRREILFFGSSLAVTLSAFLFSPLTNRRSFIEFAGELAAHEGYNAQPAERSLLEIATEGLPRLSGQFWARDLGALLLIFLSFLLFALAFRTRHLSERKSGVRLLGGVSAALLLQALAVALAPRAHLHYMCPALGLLGLPFAVAASAQLWAPNQQPTRKLLLTVPLFVALAFSSQRSEHRVLVVGKRDWTEISPKLRQMAKGPMIHAYRSSTQESALCFGNKHAGLRTFGSRLEELHPDFYHFNIWSPGISKGFQRKPISLVDLVRTHGLVYVRGDRSFFPEPPQHPLLKVEAFYGKREFLFTLSPRESQPK